MDLDDLTACSWLVSTTFAKNLFVHRAVRPFLERTCSVLVYKVGRFAGVSQKIRKVVRQRDGAAPPQIVRECVAKE